ncbi:MAG TPA: lipoprotein insertase outer membrane protein LolB [Steroidobacteraceae bacterium]
MLRKALWVLLAAALASCRTLPGPAPTSMAQSWEAHRAQLQARERFELKGRVAVAVGTEGFNARLRWTQDGNHTEMSLDGPLGTGGVQVSSDASSISIVNSRGERLDSEAARVELKSRLGFDPPLRSLRYWILGVPEPDQPARQSLDAQQRLATLEQDGWHIDYTSYVLVHGEWLPSRLNLQREGVRVRMVVDGWTP